MKPIRVGGSRRRPDGRRRSDADRAEGSDWLRRALLGTIGAYQRVISPATPRHCKYEPTCSRYATQAIREFGILRGLVLAGWRVLRCNPFSHGGFDPVSAQRVFRGSPPPASAVPPDRSPL